MTRPAAHYSLAITAALLPLVYWVTWRVLTGPFSPEVQSVVVGAVVGSAIAANSTGSAAAADVASVRAAWP